MSVIRETAQLTAKGQLTLPKAIRQALGVAVGTRVAFQLHDDGRIVVSRADAEHRDPAIGAFLNLLAAGIRTGRHVRTLPSGLARDMLKQVPRAADTDTDTDTDIDGDVAL